MSKPLNVVRSAVALLAAATVAAGCGTSLEVAAPATTPTAAAAEATPTVVDAPTEPPAPTPTVAPDPTAESEPTAAPEPTATPEPDPTATPSSLPDGFQSVEVESYYRFVAPSDWTVLTDPTDVEELLEAGTEAVGMDPAQVAALAVQLDTDGSVVLIDLGGDNMNVLALPPFDPLGQEPDQYAELLRSQFEAAAGFSDFEVAARHDSFGANEGLLAEGSYTLAGVPLTITQFIVQGSSDTFVISITLNQLDADLIATVLESFEAL